MARFLPRHLAIMLVVTTTVGACGTGVARSHPQPASSPSAAPATTTTTAPPGTATTPPAPVTALVACLRHRGVAEDVDPSLPAGELRTRLRRDLASTSDRAAIETCLVRSRASAGDRSSSGDGTQGRDPSPVSGTVPVFDGDFADPFVLQVADTFYAYATNTPLANVPFGAAQVGHRARLDGDALPALPAWSEPGHVWAPAVVANGGSYRLYYTTRDRASGRQCISVASSASPGGPFTDTSNAPLVCQSALGGSIDPSPIDVDGRRYLLWKNDGNCCGVPTRIWIAPLTGDGERLDADPVDLLSADQPWEHGLVEAPSMIEDGGRFYLFYSANAWDSAHYAMGYAVCQSVTGPCRKPGDGPWLASQGVMAGPGGGSAFRSRRGPAYLVFAAWSSNAVGYDAGGSRHLYVRPLRFTDGVPVLGAATP